MTTKNKSLSQEEINEMRAILNYLESQFDKLSGNYIISDDIDELKKFCEEN